MNMHPIVLTELVRQRQLHMLDEAKHWSSSVKLRRRAHRSGESMESRQKRASRVEGVALVNNNGAGVRSTATACTGGVIESERTELASCEV